MQTIAVTTRQDTLAEAAETFTVTLVATTLPDGVTLGTATATGTINDDDTLTAAVTGAATVAEGAAASFPVTVLGPRHQCAKRGSKGRVASDRDR